MRNFFTKRKIIIGIIIIVVVLAGYFISKGGGGNSSTLTDTVRRQDIKQTVLATGQVTSSTDLNLSFNSGGVVSSVSAKVGSQVKTGQILAALNAGNAGASLTQARGSLAAAQANYQKVLAGASNEEVVVAQKSVAASQVALDNAKTSLAASTQQQTVLVSNALTALLNSGLAAIAKSGNLGTASATVSGSYNASQQGSYVLTIYQTGNGPRFTLSGLESGDAEVRTDVAMPLGTRGLYVLFSSKNVSSFDSYTIVLPNTQAATYTSNLNAYQAALQTQQSAISSGQSVVNSAQVGLDQANASLALKQAQARPADLAAAQAQITSAQGQVQAASAALENSIIRAPAGGTITSVDIKVGEQATPGKEALVLQDVGNLHVEANVSEANIAQVAIGNAVSFTFDALGPDRVFNGVVATVDPASTVVSGVVNYKVTATVDKVPDIKPGMTANMTVLVAQKSQVLTVPAQAIVNQDTKKFVRVVDDSKKKTYHQVEVQTGLQADGGLVEILSGLNQGQEIITFIK